MSDTTKMINDTGQRVCSVEHAGQFDNRLRRWLQNPQKILAPYIQPRMTVLDVGCGPGFFSIEMARMVGVSGRVIAADLQDGMLQKLREKIQGTELEKRIVLHQCGRQRVGWTEPVDFALAFYMVHELPDQNAFFQEIGSLLTSNGHILIVEPPFHVSKAAFADTVKTARNAGLIPVAKPRVLFNKTVLLKKG
jgi:ubiquinone/menaquinone biosynthesis C-methylase UbiE